MSVVSLLGVNVLNNPAKFGDSYQFEITFECLESLQKGRLRCASMRIPMHLHVRMLTWSQISNGS